MELYEFKYFIAIWENRSISKASSVVHVSQPALSQCVKKMEQELGTPLFVRPMNSMKLTEVGQIVYSYGKEILKTEAAMENAINEIMHDDSVVIQIGMSPFYSKHFLPYVLPQLKAQFPSVSIKIVEDISSSLEEKLQNNELDFACVPQEPEILNISYEPICMEEILLAVPPDNPLNSHAIPASPFPYIESRWINGQKLVSLKDIQKISRLIDPLFDNYGLKFDIVYETLDWDTVNIMIGTGMGVGFVPDILCYNNGSRKNKPVYYRIADRTFRRHYAVAYKSNKNFTSLERHVLDLFKELVAKARANLFEGREDL